MIAGQLYTGELVAWWCKANTGDNKYLTVGVVEDNEYTGSLEAEPQGNGDVLVRVTIRVGEGRRAYRDLAVLPLLHLANVREGFDLVGATEERLVAAMIQVITDDNEKATG